MKKELLVAALIFLSISSCKKAENPVSPNWELSGKIVYSTGTSIYLLDLSAPNPVPRLLVDDACQPAVSPDGKTVAFWKISPAGSSDIYRINVDGTDMVNLSNRQWVTESSPDWSPDGQWIIFDGWSPPYQRLYIMDRDGKNIHPITDTSYFAALPSWGGPYTVPIAFLYWPPFSQEPSRRRLGAIYPEGWGMVDLDEMFGHSRPLWSPDRRWILYDVSTGYRVVDIFTRIRYPLRTDTVSFTSLFSPQWMADGSLLGVGSKIADTSDTRYGVYKISLGSREVLSARKMTDGFKGGDMAATESPDGRYVAIFGRRQEDQGLHFYVYDTGDSSLHRIAEISASGTAYVSYARWIR
ncbi:MAG: TolB family protein [Bacteroidota bacterium]